MSKLNHTDTSADAEYATVYVAFELSKANWHLGVILPGSQKLSRFRIDGGDLAAFNAHVAAWRTKAAATGKPVRIISCYEAGYDGHWLHRWLTSEGVINYVIDPASVQVNRRARRPKTDRIDLEQLVNTLLRYLRGEPRVCSMVRVPSPEDEDRRRVTRERDRLLKERTAHTNRITGLLHAQGIRDVKPLARGFLLSLHDMRTGDGRPLPARLKEEIVREHQRLSVVHQQILALEKKSMAELRAPARGSSRRGSIFWSTCAASGWSAGASWCTRRSTARSKTAAGSAASSG
jgi:transposase